MEANEVKCPKCEHEFKLADALSTTVREELRREALAEANERLKQEFDAAVAKAKVSAEQAAQARISDAESQAKAVLEKLRAAESNELALRKQREALAQEKSAMELTIQRRVDEERKQAEDRARAEAETRMEAQIQLVRAELNAKSARLEAAEKLELEAHKKQQAADEQMRQIEMTVEKQVAEKAQVLATAARAAADRDWDAKVKAAAAALEAKDEKLRQAEQAELQARQLKVQADEALRQAELTVVRRLDEERAKVRESALRERDDEYRLKLGEKEKTIEDMRKQVEELRRKGDSSSQQLVGEVLERDVKAQLREAFPGDEFDSIAKGQSGADLLQKVKTPGGKICGTILWETKRTKSWVKDWLPKLREDQRAKTASLAVLVTETLPEGVNLFEHMNNVWVTGFAASMPMAHALRSGLIAEARARTAAENPASKMELAYAYLTGPEFTQRIQGMLEPVCDMKKDLEKEKTVLQKQWGTREKQIERVVNNMSMLYGSLQGTIGSSLPVVKGLSFDAEETSNGVALLEPPANDSLPATEQKAA
jgi:hypothetical protein